MQARDERLEREGCAPSLRQRHQLGTRPGEHVAMAALTAADLLALARQQGLTAFDSPPRIGFPSKILLASLGIDVRDLATQDRLVELNRAGEIRLTRVDADWLVPVDPARNSLAAGSGIPHAGSTRSRGTGEISARWRRCDADHQRPDLAGTARRHA